MQCMYSSNSTKILDINTECIPTSFLQRRLSWLCIYSVEKYSKVVVKDTYSGYMIEMTQHSHGGQSALAYITTRWWQNNPRDRVLLG
jgi:hypothetical protein